MKKDWGKIAGGEGFDFGESNHPVDVPNKLLKYEQGQKGHFM